MGVIMASKCYQYHLFFWPLRILKLGHIVPFSLAGTEAGEGEVDPRTPPIAKRPDKS